MREHDRVRACEIAPKNENENEKTNHETKKKTNDGDRDSTGLERERGESRCRWWHDM